MDDTVSHSSLESGAGGDEFVLVNAEPRLRIANNGDVNELRSKLREVLSDELNTSAKMADVMSSDASDVTDSVVVEPKTSEVVSGNVQEKDSQQIDGNKESKKQDVPCAPHASSEYDATVFTGVTYLGSAAVDAPRSEIEINRNIAILHEQSQMAIAVTLVVPGDSQGIVYLLDPSTNTEIASYSVHRILFFARGPADSAEKRCFAFTCNRGDNADSTTFQCHVFSCNAQETQVRKILHSFATAFRKMPKSSPTDSSDDTAAAGSWDENTFRFDVSIDVKEEDSRGGWVACPKDKHVFKLRCNLEKEMTICVRQVAPLSRTLTVQRCFGLLISHGRNVKHGDMNLIEIASMVASNDGMSCTISGRWDPNEPAFRILNTETNKDVRIFLTIGIDLVLEGIQQPVRFLVEAKAKIFPQNERFWYFSKKPHTEQFVLRLRECAQDVESQFEVVSIESQTELDRKKASMMLPLSPSKMTDSIQTPQDVDDDTEGDEPLLSGTGIVSKDVRDEDLLDAWHDVLKRWHANLDQRPRAVHALVRKGIPEALRGEIWQLLVGCHDNSEMLESYRILITKESACEQVIARDINRTFPAHDFFRESGGMGQESLFRISKAYSVYDEEVGYCQGLSFLAASLLLHLPEEQAFCVLVKLMFDYNMRDLYKQGFESLHLHFYQLERLIQDQLPELYEHFMNEGLEAHMFASQWFLTLFTAKFPLYMVFHILDIFFSEGLDTIFHVAMALLKSSRKELLSCDFEGILKYFRVHLPKKYRTEESSRELMQEAVNFKISAKKLKKYEKEYIAIQEQQLRQENPIERFERENRRLVDANMRLEQENDDLAHELVTSKIALRKELDTVEDRCDVLNKGMLQTKAQLVDADEEKKRLAIEATQLKEMCRRGLEDAEAKAVRDQAIIADYKQICSQLSERLEKQQTAHKEELARIKRQTSDCGRCSDLLNAPADNRPSDNPAEVDARIASRDCTIRELELALAQTKLSLVESECRTQDLTHQLGAAIGEITATKSTWLQKTLTTLRREVGAKKDSLTAESTNVKKDSI